MNVFVNSQYVYISIMSRYGKDYFIIHYAPDSTAETRLLTSFES